MKKEKVSKEKQPEYKGYVLFKNGRLFDEAGCPEVFSRIDDAISEANYDAEKDGEEVDEYEIFGLVRLKKGETKVTYEIEW